MDSQFIFDNSVLPLVSEQISFLCIPLQHLQIYPYGFLSLSFNIQMHKWLSTEKFKMADSFVCSVQKSFDSFIVAPEL